MEGASGLIPQCWVPSNRSAPCSMRELERCPLLCLMVGPADRSALSVGDRSRMGVRRSRAHHDTILLWQQHRNALRVCKRCGPNGKREVFTMDGRELCGWLH